MRRLNLAVLALGGLAVLSTPALSAERYFATNDDLIRAYAALSDIRDGNLRAQVETEILVAQGQLEDGNSSGAYAALQRAERIRQGAAPTGAKSSALDAYRDSVAERAGTAD